MWIFHGLGVLMPALRPPATVPEGDPQTMQVRARRAADLDRFREAYCPSLGPTQATPEMDYDYRAYVEPEAFALALAQMVRDIDYTKFKPTTQRWDSGASELELHGFYNSVWSLMLSRLSRPGRSSYWPIRSTFAPATATTTAAFPDFSDTITRAGTGAWSWDRADYGEDEYVPDQQEIDVLAEVDDWLDRRREDAINRGVQAPFTPTKKRVRRWRRRKAGAGAQDR